MYSKLAQSIEELGEEVLHDLSRWLQKPSFKPTNKKARKIIKHTPKCFIDAALTILYGITADEALIAVGDLRTITEKLLQSFYDRRDSTDNDYHHMCSCGCIGYCDCERDGLDYDEAIPFLEMLLRKDKITSKDLKRFDIRKILDF